MHEIQRAVGRLESSQKDLRREIADGLKAIKDEFSAHKNEDQVNFSSIRVSMKESNDAREEHLNTQDLKLNAIAVVNARLETQDENTKTIGKWIIGAFGSLVLLIGSAVVAALSGHIVIK